MNSCHKYLCGNAFKNICQYSSGHFTSAREHHFNFKVRDDLNNKLVYVRTEYLPTFFQYINLDFPYTLITHNSDIPIDENCLEYIENPQIKKWYGQNINIAHPKVHSLPIGLANPKWPHGDPLLLDAARKAKYWEEKDALIYVNFDVGTNPNERLLCLDKTGLKNSPRENFSTYLEKTGKAYFVLSPNGNGIDCHKHWEALYLYTIPIVTRSINMGFYKDLPFLAIDDWEEFKSLNLTPELYHKIWGNFNPTTLLFENFLQRLNLNV